MLQVLLTMSNNLSDGPVETSTARLLCLWTAMLACLGAAAAWMSAPASSPMSVLLGVALTVMCGLFLVYLVKTDCMDRQVNTTNAAGIVHWWWTSSSRGVLFTVRALAAGLLGLWLLFGIVAAADILR